MKLEVQVVSLELARRLKALGVLQESYAYWWDCENPAGWWEFKGAVGYRGDRLKVFDWDEGIEVSERLYKFSAFTATELGGMLPACIEGRWYLVCEKGPLGGGGWDCGYLDDEYVQHPSWHGVGTSEADARGRLLITLLEAGVITV